MQFRVPDMNCGHCQSTIEKAIAEVGGQAKIDLTAKLVTVEGLDPARAAATIRNAGFSPEPA